MQLLPHHEGPRATTIATKTLLSWRGVIHRRGDDFRQCVIRPRPTWCPRAPQLLVHTAAIGQRHGASYHPWLHCRARGPLLFEASLCCGAAEPVCMASIINAGEAGNIYFSNPGNFSGRMNGRCVQGFSSVSHCAAAFCKACHSVSCATRNTLRFVLSCLALPCHSVRRSRDCTGLPSAGLCTWDEKTVTVAQGQPFAYRSTMPLSHYLRGVMNYNRRRAPQVVSTVAPTVAVGYYNSTATDCRTIAHKIIQTIFRKMARKLVQNCLLQYPGKSTPEKMVLNLKRFENTLRLAESICGGSSSANHPRPENIWHDVIFLEIFFDKKLD